MPDQIEIVRDDEGLAVFGEHRAVDRFLAAQGLPHRDMETQRLRTAAGSAGSVLEAGGAIAAHSGRWVKLTQESAAKIESIGLMKGSAPGLSRGVLQGSGGRIKGIVEFGTSASLLASPAALAAAGALMSQMAMQQQIDEIAEYLAVIDEKVDDVLRAHKDAALADMLGVETAIDDAMIIRDEVGRVSDITWSKVQGASSTIGRTQAYALRQLDALADKLERKSGVDDLAKVARSVQLAAQEWIAVLAHCFRLHEALSVLELDRVLDSSAEELDRHRLGVKAARQRRLELISKSTEHLIDRMSAAAARANKRVLLNPTDSPAVVRSSNEVTARVVDLHSVLGIEGDDRSVTARRWRHAVGDLKDKVVETGADGVDLGKRIGSESQRRARAAINRTASGIVERTAPARAIEPSDLRDEV